MTGFDPTDPGPAPPPPAPPVEYPRYAFAKSVRAQLLGELAAAGFPPALPDGSPRLAFDAARCWVAVEREADRDAVAAVVAAHDAAAHDAAAAAEAAQDRDAGDRLRAAVASLRDDEARLADTTVLSTLALLRPIILRLVRVQLWQLRLLMRRGAV